MEPLLHDDTTTALAPPPTDDHAQLVKRTRAASACAPLLVLLPLALWCAASANDRPNVPASHDLGARANALHSTIDANTAPWHELTALPQIGETTARAIVDYRDSQSAASGGERVFKRARDLQRVRGVGPKTVARVQPHLRFDPPPSALPADHAFAGAIRPSRTAPIRPPADRAGE
jgi:competence protein ComEA